MKYPWMQFYPGEWLKDPAVTKCSAETRGVWIDLLCVMHESDRSGLITGTPDQLSRLGRCTTVELARAIEELTHTKAADVTNRNGVVTLVNRRMQREHKQREMTALRVIKHRSVTPEKRGGNPHKSEVRDQKSEAESGRDGSIPTWDEVKAEGAMRAVPEASARKFFDYHENNSLWLNKFDRLISWRSKLITWAANDRTGTKPTGGQAKEEPVWAQIKSVESLIAGCDKRLSKITVPGGDLYPEQRANALKLRAPIIQEKTELLRKLEELNRRNLAK